MRGFVVPKVPADPEGPGPSLPDLIRVYVNKKRAWNIPAREVRSFGWDAEGFSLHWTGYEIAYIIFKDETRLELLALCDPSIRLGSTRRWGDSLVLASIDFHNPNSFEAFERALRMLLNQRWDETKRFKKVLMVFWCGHFMFTEVKIILFDVVTWFYVVCMLFVAGGSAFTGEFSFWSALCLGMAALLGFFAHIRFKRKER